MSEHVLFPPRLGARGRMATGTDEEYLRGLIEQVLFTRPGERVSRPEFGCGVTALIFEPLSDALAAATQTMVSAALQDALGALISVDDVIIAAEESTLAITVVFTPLGEPAAQLSTVVRAGNGAGGSP